jgi:hypothetical protein
MQKNFKDKILDKTEYMHFLFLLILPIALGVFHVYRFGVNGTYHREITQWNS